MSVELTGAPPVPARPPGSSPSGTASGRVGALVGRLLSFSTLIGMLAVLVVIQTMRPAFFSWANLNGVLIQSSVLVVLAVGLAVVMAMRGLDLSIAQVADLAGYVAAMLVLSGASLLVVITVALLIGLVAGAFNGLLSAYLGVPAIVSTLGTSFILQAVELVVSSNGKPQQLFAAPGGSAANFLLIGEGRLNGVPLLIIIAIVVAAVLWLVTRRTVMGRYAEALEMNAKAAYLAGVPTRRIFWAGFAISGTVAALAGVLLTSRSGIAAPGGVQPYLLDAFTAVYLGAMASPRPLVRVAWTVVGAVFVSLLANGLTLLGLGAPYRYGLNGLLILLALALGVTRRR
jgi:ribose/xylose/arabinose/galactoside ABC-type transport system permease subunit